MRARRQPQRKPPRVEFLPDELVEYDVDEVLPDEFVLDDVADVSTEAAVGFAGPSDAPPPYPVGQQSFTGSWPPMARAPRRVGSVVRVAGIAAAFAGVFGLMAAARVARAPTTPPEASASGTMAPTPAVPPDSISSHPSVTPPPTATLACSEVEMATACSVAPSADAGAAVDGVDVADAAAADAVDMKHRAQEALEKGKVAAALDLGQQAVDADPTDAESWLILGAAYLQRGKYKDARRCFASCVDQATQGPVSECKALMR